MKKWLFLLLFMQAICCAQPSKKDSITILKDSIVKLNKRPVMTSAQFIKLYKYDQLYKFYRICKNKPSQWKYYNGWSRRTFEQ